MPVSVVVLGLVAGYASGAISLHISLAWRRRSTRAPELLNALGRCKWGGGASFSVSGQPFDQYTAHRPAAPNSSEMKRAAQTNRGKS
jgi:hypothetical protein